MSSSVVKKKQQSIKSIVNQMGILIHNWKSIVHEMIKILTNVELIGSNLSSVQAFKKRSLLISARSSSPSLTMRQHVLQAVPSLLSLMLADLESLTEQYFQMM
jgi:hypothetical protein